MIPKIKCPECSYTSFHEITEPDWSSGQPIAGCFNSIEMKIQCDNCQTRFTIVFAPEAIVDIEPK